MPRRKRNKVPARLERVHDQFMAWRKVRKRGERIPKRMWESAAKMASDYGLKRTATVLGLDYVSLKSHVDRQRTDSSSTATFVELPSPYMAAASECVIELEDGSGASMRVHLKGNDLPDVLALARGFWDPE